MTQTTISLYFGGKAGPSTQSLGDKRPATTDPGASKHRKSGIEPSWMDDFPWLELLEDEVGETRLWCSKA